MNKSTLDYKKVNIAYDMLMTIGVVSTYTIVTKEILSYILAFPKCNNTELQFYVFNKVKEYRNIEQNQISVYLKRLAKYNYIIIEKNGKENNLSIGPMYYKLINILNKYCK